MKKINAYYESFVQASQTEEFACANLWKQSWENMGWTTCMMNSSHAQSSGLFQKLHRAIAESLTACHPDVASRMAWIKARFSRWCALHACGGGWMADYDVVNTGFTPANAEVIEQRTTIATNSGPAYVIYATKDHAANAIKKFIQSPLLKGNCVLDDASILELADTLEGEQLGLVHAKPFGEKRKPDVMRELLLQK